MNYCIVGHGFAYEVQTMIQVFFPNEEYHQVAELTDGLLSECKGNLFSATLYVNNEVKGVSSVTQEDGALGVKQSIYKLLSAYCNFQNPWGVLTGVRPSKIAGKWLHEGYTPGEIVAMMKERYYVTEEKSLLCIDVYEKEAEIIQHNAQNHFSLYIGIPFCPTRCLYCSFTAYPIGKYQNQVAQYLQCLEKEMQLVAQYNKTKTLETIYIGGGTPTALDENQLAQLLHMVSMYFDVKHLKEFTVEAGRPDTITRKKLETLLAHHVTRISINPQTMKQETLQKIGRKHTIENFLESYSLARAVGLHNINIDLILGLPDETIDDVAQTLEKIQALNPESITVHTLAIKRASELRQQRDTFVFPDMETMEKMLALAKETATKMGMVSYYMYRQKNMIGNFENVGYCKEGREGIYNVQIMEEKQTIIAIGAGATSKLVHLATDHIERIFNVKSIEDYLLRIDEMVERKKRILEE